MRNAESAAFVSTFAFVWVILITQRKERSVVFGHIFSEGLLGLEDGVAELGFEDGLRLRGKGEVEFCGSTSDRVDENFARIWGDYFGAQVEKG